MKLTTYRRITMMWRTLVYILALLLVFDLGGRYEQWKHEQRVIFRYQTELRPAPTPKPTPEGIKL